MTNTVKQPLAAIIVVYNQSCTQSLTCQQLLALGKDAPEVLVFDNSTRDFGNRDFCRDAGWVYLGGQGNLGLSKAYNACIDHLKGQGFAGFVCLFDDDTAVTGEYFLALRSAIAAGGQLFVPFIYSGSQLLSPCRITPSHKSILFPDEKTAMTYTGSDISAINSAMAMDMALFEDYRYDENIFLDGIDHTHLQKMAAKNIRPVLLDVRFHHNFSGNEKPPRAAALTRFRIFARDYAYIFRENKSRYWFLVGKRAVRLTLQYKSPLFLKILTNPKQEVL